MATTDTATPIRIEVKTAYIEGESSPGEGRYVFAYTITIHNAGTVPARLVSRYWRITDGNGHTREVRGDGVVGEQPYLRPGESFRYTSGAELPTTMGTMSGHYDMVDDQGAHFTARIPEFLLSLPRTLH